jgi:hypothetical protein
MFRGQTPGLAPLWLGLPPLWGLGTLPPLGLGTLDWGRCHCGGWTGDAATVGAGLGTLDWGHCHHWGLGMPSPLGVGDAAAGDTRH